MAMAQAHTFILHGYTGKKSYLEGKLSSTAVNAIVARTGDRAHDAETSVSIYTYINKSHQRCITTRCRAVLVPSDTHNNDAHSVYSNSQ